MENYKPKYMCWWEEDFWTDRSVVMMPWQARHFYRALLQAALFCATRPYLPIDDTQLAILADAPIEDWQKFKSAVLHKFTKVTIEGVELWSHHRLMQDWTKLKSEHDKFSEAGKRGNAKRWEKESSGGDQGAITAPSQIVNCELRTVNSEDVKLNNDSIEEVNDASLMRQPQPISTSQGTESGFAAAPTLKATTSRPSGEAENLVECMHFLLSQRKDKVSIPKNYASYWLSDFQAALKTHTFAEIKSAIVYSQLPRNQKYYVRAAGILKSLESLVEQAAEPANAKACAVLYQQALKNQLPPPKQDGAAPPVAGSVLGVMNKANGRPCTECPDGVPPHAAGECPDPQLEDWVD